MNARGWRPIEEAPKDGTRVLVGWDGSDEMNVAEWDGHRWAEDDIWYSPQPTHWMPLPTPPDSES